MTLPDHLSHSQVTTFKMCPRLWRYRYITKAEVERVGSALVFGSAIHAGAEAKNKAYMGLEAPDPVAEFTTTFAEKSAEAPVAWGKDTPEDLRTKGLNLLAAYEPPKGTVGVEEAIEVRLADDLPPVVGRIDLMTTTEGGLTVFDLKSAKSSKLTDMTTVEDQLGLYQHATGADKTGVVVLAKTKTPRITTTLVDARPVDRLRHEYQQVHRAMKAGHHYRQRGWQCASCSYRDRCKADR